MSEGNGHDRTGDAAFVIRIAGQAGTRAIDVTFGVPLNMTVTDLNAYVDKVCMVIDRQVLKGHLDKAKLVLEDAEKSLITNRENRQNFINKSQESWVTRGRQGPWQPSGSEKSQLDSWDTNIQEFIEKRIPTSKRAIAEIEALIARGG